MTVCSLFELDYCTDKGVFRIHLNCLLLPLTIEDNDCYYKSEAKKFGQDDSYIFE